MTPLINHRLAGVEVAAVAVAVEAAEEPARVAEVVAAVPVLGSEPASVRALALERVSEPVSVLALEQASVPVLVVGRLPAQTQSPR